MANDAKKRLRRCTDAPLTLEDLQFMRNLYQERRIAPEATMAQPGSPEKIEVMRQRVKRGYSCFHPKDL